MTQKQFVLMKIIKTKAARSHARTRKHTDAVMLERKINETLRNVSSSRQMCWIHGPGFETDDLLYLLSPCFDQKIHFTVF